MDETTADYTPTTTRATPQLPTATDSLMTEAFALTRGDRHQQYGDPVQAAEAYAQVWTGLLAHKLRPGAQVTAADFALLMTSLKLTREIRNSKRDNVVDAHGYLSILARIRKWVA